MKNAKAGAIISLCGPWLTLGLIQILKIAGIFGGFRENFGKYFLNSPKFWTDRQISCILEIALLGT
jgi:hypothetical protein